MGELTCDLRLFSHLFGLARVATDFSFIQKGKVKKAQEKPLILFLELGGLIMKREGISTLSIHGYPWALSYLLRSLALHFQLFEMVLLCVWV